MKGRPFPSVGLACAVLLWLVGPVPADPPAIYNLGSLGAQVSIAHSVNASGQVVGEVYTMSIGPSGPIIEGQAFLYTGKPGAGGAMYGLGDFGAPAAAYAINASGQIVGSGLTVAGVGHGFLYTGVPGSGGQVFDLGVLSGGSGAADINSSGQIVGSSGPFNGGHAFLYNGIPGSGGRMTDLDTLGGSTSSAGAINDSGQIVGSSRDAGGSGRAFLYTGTPGSGGHMVDLGTLGGSSARATDINASGQVCGTSDLSAGIWHAYLYSGVPGSGGHMDDLGTLGGPDSWGEAVNARGQVVGYSNHLTGNTNVAHAFVYLGTPGLGGRMIDLDAWLDANNPAEGAKWTLGIAYDINDNGLIVGAGDYNDGGTISSRAFLVDASSLVPEPASLSVFAVAAVGLLTRRRPGGR